MRTARAWLRLSWPAWGYFAALALFFLFHVTPRKGVMFSDEGWYLYNAVRALRFGELDLFLPQAPSYLVNAALMALLGEGYLGLRVACSLCLVAAAALLLAGVGGRDGAFRRTLAPGLGCVLVSGLSSLINYQNGPSLFLAMGLGLHFLAGETDGKGAGICLRLGAGLALALSAMVNLTVAPGLVLVCLAIVLSAWRRRDPAAAVTPVAAGVFLAAMLGWYLSRLGLGELFRVPKGHGFHYGRILEILRTAVVWPAAWGALFVLGRLARRAPAPVALVLGAPGREPSLWGLGLATLTAAAFLAASLCVASGVAPPFPLGRLPEYNPVIILPQFAYAVLCLAVLGGDFSEALHRRGAACALALLLYWGQQTFYSDVGVPFSMVFAAGLMLALGLGLLAATDGRRPGAGRGGRRMRWAAALVFTGGCLAYWFAGGWSGETRLAGPKVALAGPRLEGILESPERAELLAALRRAYDENGCGDRVLLTFRNTSLLYYVLDRKAPPRLSYMSQNFGIYKDDVRALLDSGAPWCVLYSENIRLIADREQERELLDLIESRAQKRQDLGSHPPRHLFDDFVLFVGPRP